LSFLAAATVMIYKMMKKSKVGGKPLKPLANEALKCLWILLDLSLKALSERRTRATLTIVGIAIGPLVLVMMSSVVGSYSSYIVERVTSLGQNAIAIFPTENYQLDEEDLNYIRT
jgi:hypothetical protein